MDFHLLIVNGRSASKSLALSEGVTTVGRHDACQIRIRSAQVSRKHCELFEKKGMLLVKDLGSANGTLVNGKKIKDQQVLEPGDELHVGPVTLRVAKKGEEPPTKKPAAPAPGDTAVVEAVVAEGGDDADFDIDFDDIAEDATVDDAIPLEDEPTAVPPTKSAPATPAAAKGGKEKGKDPEMADDAIADFLLDIKLDEDE